MPLITKEFEGKNLEEALKKAQEHFQSEVFNYQILEEKVAGFLKKGYVKIGILEGQSTLQNTPRLKEPTVNFSERRSTKRRGRYFKGEKKGERSSLPEGNATTEASLSPDLEKYILQTLNSLLSTLRTDGKAQSVQLSETDLLYVEIITEKDPNLLIGKKGKNLDALQILLNKMVSFQFPQNTFRILLDVKDYRIRREDYLVRLAIQTADTVKEMQQPKLLDPLSPAERRIIHMTLEPIAGILTRSIGNGYTKSIRIDLTSEKPKKTDANL